MKLVRLLAFVFFSLWALQWSPSLSANEMAAEDYWYEVNTGEDADTSDTVGEMGDTLGEMINPHEVNTHDDAEMTSDTAEKTPAKGDNGCAVSYLSATGVSAMLFLIVFLLSLVLTFRRLKREHD